MIKTHYHISVRFVIADVEKPRETMKTTFAFLIDVNKDNLHYKLDTLKATPDLYRSGISISIDDRKRYSNPRYNGFTKKRCFFR